MGSDRGGVYGRLALTLIVSAAALLLAQIPIPGVNLELFEKIAASASRPSGDRDQIGILCLQLNSVREAVLLIEVLALLIPRWRSWRAGGYPERQRLWTRAMIVGLLFVAIQSYFIVRWLRSSSDTFSPFGQLLVTGSRSPLMMAAQMSSLVGGTFLLVWLTRLIDDRGVGNGFSVIIAAFAAKPLIDAFLWSVPHRVEAGDRILVPLGAAVVVVAAVSRLASGRPLRPQAAKAAPVELPTPSSGIQPGLAAFWLVGLPVALTKWGFDIFPDALLSGELLQRGLAVGLTAPLCLLFAWLFNRPRAVAEALLRAGASDTPAVRDAVRAAFARSLAWSLVVCWALMGVSWFLWDAQLHVDIVLLTVFACVATDVVDEIRFRRRNSALVRIWPVHRLYLLPIMLKALEAAEIPAFARGRCHRTLLNFVAPWVPVDILVPVDRASRAEAILGALAGAPAPAEIAPPPAQPLPI